MINFTTTDPGSLVIAGIILFILAFNCVFIVFAYTSIVALFQAILRKQAKANAVTSISPPSTHNKNPGNMKSTVKRHKASAPTQSTNSAERLLIEKSIAFSAAFLVCWIPYILKVVIEIATKEPVSFEYDCICDLAGCTNPLLNVIVLLKYDSRVKQNVVELMSMIIPKTSRILAERNTDHQGREIEMRNRSRPIPLANPAALNVVQVTNPELDALETRLM